MNKRSIREINEAMTKWQVWERTVSVEEKIAAIEEMSYRDSISGIPELTFRSVEGKDHPYGYAECVEKTAILSEYVDEYNRLQAIKEKRLDKN